MACEIEPDFPSGLKCLKNVDVLLRCPICFDFLNISMMTKCSHNFCSLCIRKYLAYKLQCPVCNTPATEQDLRNNRLLDEVVVNFQGVRGQLSKVHFDSPPISPKTPASAVKCRTPRDRGQKSSSSVLSNFFQKRPKTSPAKETKQDGSAAPGAHPGKIQTARRHTANDTDLHSVTSHIPVKVKEEPMDEGEVAVRDLMSIKQEDAASHDASGGNVTAHASTPTRDIKPVIKVECPVCSVGVSQQFINKHLDTCLTRGEKKESLRSSLGKARQPMGKLVYNLLSLQELKRKLKECHLPVQGSRDQMIKRHKEFVHIYNAQCDSLNPKSAEDIAEEVDANEKIRNKLQGKAKPVMVISKNQTEKEIDECHSNYRKQHSSDFSRLIAQVRGRLDTTRQARIKQEVISKGDCAQETHSAGQVVDLKGSSEIKVEDGEVDENPMATGAELPPSPSCSDVSISSSISDIFGPELVKNHGVPERSAVQKRTSSSREASSAASPILGKRRRKT